MRTRPGFQVRGIRSNPRLSLGLERLPSTWKPGLVQIGGFWMTSQNQFVLAQWISVLVMSVSMNKPIMWNYVLSPRTWTIISSSRTGKKQLKSSIQYFHGISSSLTWCHSARLIGWNTHEFLMSLENAMEVVDRGLELFFPFLVFQIIVEVSGLKI